ncbi:hypothetical protein G5714_019228 [Onychostoma macrolepis]|uniref:Prospero domain-containing protein n=1 Tax=Onychostoma macrolepis TaxID=369639 RepID=A0A7J6BZR0_9TELE|nr:hypothetical protein G5714_019228 [Onychostoma macrolepis]
MPSLTIHKFPTAHEALRQKWECLPVPERFLEVAQITLREFFSAIVASRDVDPSWKKAIYKVICKLDSEVPQIFKSANCLQELLRE